MRRGTALAFRGYPRSLTASLRGRLRWGSSGSEAPAGRSTTTGSDVLETRDADVRPAASTPPRRYAGTSTASLLAPELVCIAGIAEGCGRSACRCRAVGHGLRGQRSQATEWCRASDRGFDLRVLGVSSAPAHWECDVVLVDGGTVHVRPITPEDADALVAFHSRLSDETVYFRFFSPMPALSQKQVERFTNVDHDRRVALVAELADRLVGIARYERLPGTDSAEVAFVVADAHQGRGIGTALLEHLASAARERGITRFVAETLTENAPMLDVFRSAGFDEHARFDGGVAHVGGRRPRRQNGTLGPTGGADVGSKMVVDRGEVSRTPLRLQVRTLR